MAVYTQIADEDLVGFLKDYAIGDLVSYAGIAEGVENSNFLLRTTAGTYILTLYEKRVKPEDLPFFIALMEHLSRQGLSCPTPIAGHDGTCLRQLCGRPAAIVTFLDGVWHRRISPAHCRELGTALARLHLAGKNFEMRRPNNLSVADWGSLLAASGLQANDIYHGLFNLLNDELRYLTQAWPSGLPEGVIHADLFPDNVFFLGDTLSGLIDFYFACTDALAYDLAICLNAWCFEADGSFNITKSQQMVTAYEKVRPLSAVERAAIPVLARGAALRFLLTRLYDWLNHPKEALVKPKDPLEYLSKLRFHQQLSGIAGYGL